MSENQKYITIKRASEICHVTDQTIRNAIAKGKLSCTKVPSGNSNGDKMFVDYDELMVWIDNRKKRITTIPGVSDLTIDDLAEELLKRIQKAYDEGYKAGVAAAKEEFSNALKAVKL
jgi:hypothetical protein